MICLFAHLSFICQLPSYSHSVSILLVIQYLVLNRGCHLQMGPHQTHMFSVDEKIGEKISHVRITIAPDGGVARFRVWGVPQH